VARIPPRRGKGLPSKADILTFLKEAGSRTGKREIARAFAVKGRDRASLKALLAEMAQEGLLAGNRKRWRPAGALPPVAVLEIVARDSEGELVAEPAVWEEAGARPRVLVLAERAPGGEPVLGEGDRILAKLTELADADVFGYRYEAEPIRRLARERRRQLGIFRTRPKGGGVIDPIDRRELKEWPVAPGDQGSARSGDLVRFELTQPGRFGLGRARVLEALGNPADQRRISLIALNAHGLRDAFPDAVLAEADAHAPAASSGRKDLTALGLLTIDPADARDHDDAVHAAADPDRSNPGGFIVHVAIADVAHYVRPGSRLDREALARANSIYFPDQVVPMLPERISNDLCSLRPGELRPAIAARMIFDRHGNKRAHQFMRAMMRSAARLSYEEAQAAIDGAPNAKCAPLLQSHLRPLWAAYAALAAARARRAPLDLDLPERKIVLDAEGRVERIVVPRRLDAHRLIEEFMIQANVAAAETLEAKRTPLIYRVHDAPAAEKLVALREFLAGLGLKLASGRTPGTGDFARLLAKAKDSKVADLVNEVVLRSQAQAVYAAHNFGHFGLNLPRYAHFTSPIRRYADLVVHRALIAALDLGAGGLRVEDAARLEEIAQAISEGERRAMAAERETADRLVAAYLADRVGAEFEARVAGVTRSGLFVRLRQTGADGFVPAATLGGDYFRHHEHAHALIGDRTGAAFRLGDDVRVRLVEVIPSAGALRFEMVGRPDGPATARSARRHPLTRARQR